MAGALVCVGAAFYTGLRLRVAVESALDELDLALDFAELGIFLAIVDRSREDQPCNVSMSKQ
jgi:hypothetical protein